MLYFRDSHCGFLAFQSTKKSYSFLVVIKEPDALKHVSQYADPMCPALWYPFAFVFCIGISSDWHQIPDGAPGSKYSGDSAMLNHLDPALTESPEWGIVFAKISHFTSVITSLLPSSNSLQL
jgi:hypothetical protein